MPMNNRLLVPQKLPLLLDFAPGAAAAYSLRSLSNSYTGPVVTVRRSTDSAERDFTATEVSDGTLAAWCGGGDGYVKTWHDQSQHGRDASQSTAGYQPQIVASGVVILEGGKPAIQLDGVDDYLSASVTGFRNIQNLTAIIIFSTPVAAQADTNTAVLWFFGAAGGVNRYMVISSETSALSGEYLTIAHNPATSRRLGSSHYRRNANQSSMLFSTHLQSGTKVYADGAAVSLDLSIGMTTTTAAAPSDTGYTADDTVVFGCVISSGTPVAFVQEKFQEVIYYPTDQTALRTRIEADMAFYY